MRRVYAGAVAIIAGIAAFIEAASHKPLVAYAGETARQIQREVDELRPERHYGLSQTAYNLLRIGAGRSWS